MKLDFQNLLQRKTLERIKWALFISVPAWFGYGFAKDPANLEWVKEKFPSIASERQPYGAKQLNTLEDELNAYAIERRIEAAIEELKRKKAAKGDK